MDPIALDGGTILHISPGDGDALVLSSDPHALRPPFWPFGSSSDSEDASSCLHRYRCVGFGNSAHQG